MKEKPKADSPVVNKEISSSKENLELLPRDSDGESKERIKKTIDISCLMENLKVLKGIDKERQKEMIESLARLVIEIEDQIPNYDTILSDDTSGRLASLVLRDVINRKKKEIGQEPLNTYFIRSGAHDDEEINDSVDEFIDTKKNEIKKALVVTEYIHSGKSMNNLAIRLQEQIDFDIAAVSVGSLISIQDKKYGDLLNRLRYGNVGQGGLTFHSSSYYSGVTKNKPGKSAHPMKANIKADEIKEAREDVKLLADEMSKLIIDQE